MTAIYKYGLLNGLGCPCNESTPLSLGEAPAIVKFNTQPNKSADGRSAKWGCTEWMIWHKALVDAFMNGLFSSKIKYSKAQAIIQANTVFMQWWDKIAGGFLPSQLTFCGYGSDFYYYFTSVGLKDVITTVASILTPVIGGAGNVANSTGNVLTTTGQAAENIVDTANNTSKTLKWLIPLAIIGGVSIAGYYAYKHYAKGNSRVKIGKTTV